MIIKKNKKKLEAKTVFPTIDLFIKHVLEIDKNLRNNNTIIKNFFNKLYYDFLSENEEVMYTQIIFWVRKKHNFKTKKYSNLEYFIERGWNENDAKKELEKRYNEIKKRNRLCVEYWIKNGFTEEESKNKISEQQKLSSTKVINRRSGSKKVLKEKGWSDKEIDVFMKNKSLFSKEYWVKRGYTENEAELKISEIQKNNSEKLFKKKNENPEKYKGTLTVQKEYWIKKGYSDEESIELVKQRQQTFTLDKCIEKYGEIKGKEIFTERQIKWKDTLVKNGNIKNGYSKISQELFWLLLDKYKIDDRKFIYFSTHNNEYKIKNPDGGIFLYDFTDLKNKKIIEFNGDMFHGNPQKYNATDNPNPFNKTIIAENLWKRDKIKVELAKEHGFDVLVVWDSEYRYNKKYNTIKKCQEFLKIS